MSVWTKSPYTAYNWKGFVSIFEFLVKFFRFQANHSIESGREIDSKLWPRVQYGKWNKMISKMSDLYVMTTNYHAIWIFLFFNEFGLLWKPSSKVDTICCIIYSEILKFINITNGFQKTNLIKFKGTLMQIWKSPYIF